MRKHPASENSVLPKTSLTHGALDAGSATIIDHSQASAGLE
jgi:hypothetical protein